MEGTCPYRCPDCGHSLDIPYRIEGSRIVLDEDAFIPLMERHIEFNPDIHPSFVTVD